LANPRRTLTQVLSGTAYRNIRFSDLRQLVLALGFRERTRGDHHIYSQSGIVEIINLQPDSTGMAKPYQVRQVRELVLRYKLNLEEAE